MSEESEEESLDFVSVAVTIVALVILSILGIYCMVERDSSDEKKEAKRTEYKRVSWEGTTCIVKIPYDATIDEISAFASSQGYELLDIRCSRYEKFLVFKKKGDKQ